MSFNFPPKGWALCNGQLLPINQNQALFSLVGTVYGGDGRVNFALPNLQGRVPIHRGASNTLGERSGEQGHTLTITELPMHAHSLNGITTQAPSTPPIDPDTNTVLATSTPQNIYGPAGNAVAFAPNAISNVGGSQAHTNMQPYLVLNFSIALQGIFPSQT